MKIFGWAADQEGCGYYRVGMPLAEIRTRYPSADTQASVTITNAIRAETDLIIGQRVCNPAPTKTWQDMAKEKTVIFEIDDDLWHVHPTNETAYDFFSQPEILKNLTDNASVADAVTVTTEKLAEVVRQFNEKVYVLPNCVDNALIEYERPHADRLTVGWAGSQTHHMDFKLVAQQLSKFLRKNPAWDMHFMGMSYEHMMKRECRYTPWTAEIAQYQGKIDFDIGIAPLASDGFNESKSPIKCLEYAALGIPVVASDFGPYHDFVEHGVTGFLVKYDHEWGKYLYELASDEELRRTMGEAAKKMAREHTIQKNVHKWAEVYEEVVRDSTKEKVSA